MAWFQRRAEQERRPGEELEESLFRYPGPLPAGPEAAAVMLADAIEASARAQGAASPARLRALVRGVAAARLQEGQLAESGLDLARLARMEEALIRVLRGMYHGRVKYPGQARNG
jgi:membrane-associated HD superfamily phosphohydrolase